MSKNRVYFPNLNAVRFIAALLVIVHHLELIKSWFGQPNIYSTSFVGGAFGRLGIILFFVLSGFLITYLLLEEFQNTDRISIKNFYIRRILRIWPLYYLIVLLGLFVFPHIAFLHVPEHTEYVGDDIVPKTIMFMTFFSNLAYTLYTHVPFAEQSWSVGVEEQFYLIWPLLVVMVIRVKRMIPMLLSVIGIYLSFKVLAIYMHYHSAPDSSAWENFYQFWTHFSVDCMAIGGIAAYILFHKKDKILNILYNKYLQIALYGFMAVATIKGIAFYEFTNETYAVCFAIIILNLASNPNSVINMEYKPLNYLGKISYGLYMYHNIFLVFSLKLILVLGLADLSTISGNVLYYTMSLTFTIIVSSLSYEYFEKWFIKSKNKYSTVISGDNVEDDSQNQDERRSQPHSKTPLPLPQTV